MMRMREREAGSRLMIRRRLRGWMRIDINKFFGERVRHDLRYVQTYRLDEASSLRCQLENTSIDDQMTWNWFDLLEERRQHHYHLSIWMHHEGTEVKLMMYCHAAQLSLHDGTLFVAVTPSPVRGYQSYILSKVTSCTTCP